MRDKAPNLYLHCSRGQGRGGIENLCTWNRRGCGIISPHWEYPRIIIRIRWWVRVVRRVIRWRIGAVPIAPWVLLLHRAASISCKKPWPFAQESRGDIPGIRHYDQLQWWTCGRRREFDSIFQNCPKNNNSLYFPANSPYRRIWPFQPKLRGC